MASHSLSNYQKMERMMHLLPLGYRKSSVMLAKMLEFCPAGKYSIAVFAFLFLHRFPREILVLLSEDNPADTRAIAEKADRLIAMHMPQSHDSCAAVAAEDQQVESCVIAVGQAALSRKGKGPKHPQQKALGRRINLSKKNQEQGASLPTSMCYYHAKFSEQAKFCEDGRKAWSPGRCFGDPPQSPFLRDGQFV
jgi:hypothetical protein